MPWSATSSGWARGLLDGFGVAGPAGRHGCVAGLLEELQPRLPRGRVQPEAVDEDDGDAGFAHVVLLLQGLQGSQGSQGSHGSQVHRVGTRPPSMVTPVPVRLATRSPASRTTRPATSWGRVKRRV